MAIDIKPHAYDPVTQPELFEGVLARRVIAFVIDFVIIAVPVVLAAMFIFAFGMVTLGLGLALYWLLSPATVMWALVYFGLTLGGAALGHHRHAGRGSGNAHLVRGAGLFRARRGARHRVLGHVSVLTPFILLVALFNDRRRLLHDIVLGAVVINNTGARATRCAGP